MNILFLTIGTANPVTGGVASVSYYYYSFFKKRGYNILMLGEEKTIETENKDFIYLPNPQKFLSIENKEYLDKIISQHQIQIIFNHTCLAPSFSYILKYIKKKYESIKVISTYHSSPFGVYGIRKYPELVELKYSTLKLLIDRTIRYLFWIKYHKLLKMQAEYSDKIVMLSEKFIPEYLFFAGRKYFPKMMGIPNPLTIEELPREKKENVILFVGRLSREKGLPYLLKIWKLLEDRYPDWKLQIVGDGAERVNAEKMVRHLGLQRCTFYGRQKPEPFYNKAKIFCLTSLFEGFGLVLTEAMHYGVVPLAFNSYPNVEDIIDDKVNGFIIPPFDIEKYANKISVLIENESLRLKMSESALQKSEEFAIPTIGLKWEELFRELLTRS